MFVSRPFNSETDSATLLKVNLTSVSACAVYHEPPSLTRVQLYVGLASSVLLLVLAAVLIRRTHYPEYPQGLDTSGVLQIAWLLGNEPRLATVQRPDLNALRVAGMYEVDYDALRLRHLNSPSGGALSKNVEVGEEQYLYAAGSQTLSTSSFAP